MHDPQPQVCGVEMFVSHPLSAGPEPQWPYPVLHELVGITQWPAWHDVEAPGFTLASWPQSWPQMPQFRGSVCRLAQLLPHLSGVPPEQALTHWNEPPEAEQRSPAAHFRSHRPQVSGRARFVSQPSSTLLVQ